ncbi:hypothetical protein M501DRAFT_996908 [Patellaria atrata CBS 101060]|uniref:Uncharacterized protein n=1 Tax=Patellaria atrata CBS 101060 TaxID=1346257 RepID=A0A9P4S5T9_9PEZI|nr:hypothetical protein M501DRAFT_996908 [Patellaria atrata CBS 101060]
MKQKKTQSLTSPPLLAFNQTMRHAEPRVCPAKQLEKTSTNYFRFMDLPAELRIEVYRHILKSHTDNKIRLYWSDETHNFGVRMSGLFKDKVSWTSKGEVIKSCLTAHPLLLTSRGINMETATVLFKESSFFFQDLKAFHTFLQMTSLRNRQQLAYISLRPHTDSDLRSFNHRTSQLLADAATNLKALHLIGFYVWKGQGSKGLLETATSNARNLVGFLGPFLDALVGVKGSFSEGIKVIHTRFCDCGYDLPTECDGARDHSMCITTKRLMGEYWDENRRKT